MVSPRGFGTFLTHTCANQYSAEYTRVTLCIFPEFFFLGRSIFSGALSGKFVSDSQFHLINWWSLQAPPRDFLLDWWPGNSLKTVNWGSCRACFISFPSLKGLCPLLALCPFCCLSQEVKSDLLFHSSCMEMKASFYLFKDKSFILQSPYALAYAMSLVYQM